MALMPIIKGLIFGIVGFLIGGGGTVLVRGLTGRPPWSAEPVITIGYVIGLTGWLIGIGVWDYWAREWFGLPLRAEKPHGGRRYFAFCTDHKIVGVQYLVTFIALFLVAGLLAILMRVELYGAGSEPARAGVVQ